MQISYLFFFDLPPVPVFIMLVFLEHFIEFPQKVCVNVPEQSLDDLLRESLDVSFQNLKELVYLIFVAGKTV